MGKGKQDAIDSPQTIVRNGKMAKGSNSMHMHTHAKRRVCLLWAANAFYMLSDRDRQLCRSPRGRALRRLEQGCSTVFNEGEDVWYRIVMMVDCRIGESGGDNT